MTTNELRIGNYIEYDGKFFQVIEIGLYGILATTPQAQCACKFTNPNLKPILLTEEWFIKFGFNLIGEKADPRYSKKIELYYSLDIDIDWGAKNEWSANHDSHYICQLKYVHQLQNLYFALTGEELKIS